MEVVPLIWSVSITAQCLIYLAWITVPVHWVQWTAVLWKCLFPAKLNNFGKGTLASRFTGREEHCWRRRACWWYHIMQWHVRRQEDCGPVAIRGADEGGYGTCPARSFTWPWDRWENHIGAVKTKDGKSLAGNKTSEHDQSQSTYRGSSTASSCTVVCTVTALYCTTLFVHNHYTLQEYSEI